ncbi:hypothetical protein ABBQ32_004079 [Trebouxia sp. C0010 RCD-2024]
MERAVARASLAYKANEVALDDGRDLPITQEDTPVNGSTNNLAHVEPSPKSGRNLNHVRTAKQLRTAAAVTVNLRDCGSISRILRQGRMFRSSQVMSAAEIDRLGIRSVLDLRIMQKDCKKEAKDFDNAVHEMAYTIGQPAMKMAKGIQELTERGPAPPVACHICSDEFEEAYNHEANVFHADLVPAKVKMFIFYGMPKKTKLKTIFAPLCGQSPEQVMAPAVADSHKLGYDKLYRLLLDHGKKEIAKALRVFVDADNYPVLVHCIHGKDRTGLIVMLIMLLCSVEPETVVLDYIQSEINLKSSRDKSELGLATYLTSDCVMASKAHTMQSTIEYMNRKYGSAAGYVKVIGITPSEVSQIRLNMLIKAAPRDLLERLSVSQGVRGRSPGSPANSLRRRTVSQDGMLNGSLDGSKNDRFDSSSLSTTGSSSANRTRQLHKRSIARRSKTLGSMSRRTKDFPNSLETISKLPEDILINRKVTDAK